MRLDAGAAERRRCTRHADLLAVKERLGHAAEQAGDVHAADVLKDAAARLRPVSPSS